MWQELDVEQETAWLGGPRAKDSYCGYDPTGWPASTWIGHTIYELQGFETDLTHDDIHKARIEAGVEEPTLIAGVDLDAQSILVGGSLGMADPLPAGWEPLSWHELAGRTGADFTTQKYPPNLSWFPFKSWPATLRPPDEGSLDHASLHHLKQHLLRTSSEDYCVAIYPMITRLEFDGPPDCYGGPISQLEDLVDPQTHRIGTPGNFWPRDREWFVYTDWDLSATKVSGPEDLIDQIRQDSSLDTIEWPNPTG